MNDPFMRAGIDWAPTTSNATRKRRLFAGVQIAGVAAIAAGSVVGAFLMQNSWPESVVLARTSANAIWIVLTGILQTVWAPEFRRFVPLLVLAPIVYVAVFQWANFYYQRTGPIAPFRDLPKILRATIAGLVLLFLAATAYGIYPASENHRTYVYCLYFGVLMLWGTALYRSGLLCALFLLRSMGIGHTRVAIIATTEPTTLRNEFIKPGSEHTMVGIIAISQDKQGLSTPPLGTLDKLEEIINKLYLDEIVLVTDPSDLSVEQRLNLAHTCWKLGADLKMVTPFHPYFHTSARPELVGDTALLRVERAGLYTTRSQVIKRTIDIVASGLGLLVLSPLLLLVALLIRLESKGPVLFRQERPGLHGRVFRIIKFRSMFTGSDTAAHREAQRKLIQEGKPSGYDDKGQPIYGKVADDPRITRVGKFIRRTSIDELPQLFNVFRGEMSLVGPRPAVLSDLEDFKEWHLRRHNIRPGITGLWQVSGRSRLTFDQMVELDIKYIEEWSLMLDLQILARTLPAVLNIDKAF